MNDTTTNLDQAKEDLLAALRQGYAHVEPGTAGSPKLDAYKSLLEWVSMIPTDHELIERVAGGHWYDI